jgi:hypothetical protein
MCFLSPLSGGLNSRISHRQSKTEPRSTPLHVFDRGEYQVTAAHFAESLVQTMGSSPQCRAARGGCRRTGSTGQKWVLDLVLQAAPPFPAGALTRPALPPAHMHMRGRGGTPWGSLASQPPVEFRPCSLWVVWTGSGRVSAPKFAARTAVDAAWRFSRSLRGPEKTLNASVTTSCATGCD